MTGYVKPWLVENKMTGYVKPWLVESITDKNLAYFSLVNLSPYFFLLTAQSRCERWREALLTLNNKTL